MLTSKVTPIAVRSRNSFSVHLEYNHHSDRKMDNYDQQSYRSMEDIRLSKKAKKKRKLISKRKRVQAEKKRRRQKSNEKKKAQSQNTSEKPVEKSNDK